MNRGKRQAELGGSAIEAGQEQDRRQAARGFQLQRGLSHVGAAIGSAPRSPLVVHYVAPAGRRVDTSTSGYDAQVRASAHAGQRGFRAVQTVVPKSINP